MATREGGFGCKIYYIYRGTSLFHSFLPTGKVVEDLIEFKYKYTNIGIKLTNLSTLISIRCSDL